MINLKILKDTFNIYKFNTDYKIPSSLYTCDFCSITKTNDEISILTNHKIELKSKNKSTDWRGFKVEGILDFSLAGIINDITKPLKDNGISVFVISTFNTDYLFVKSESFNKTIEVFKITQNINIKN